MVRNHSRGSARQPSPYSAADSASLPPFSIESGDAERNSDLYGKSDYCFRPTFSTLRM